MFSYELPPELIARFPPQSRDGGRLYALGTETPHRLVTELPALLRAGDLLVVNDTRVLHARVRALRATGGAVEVFLLSDAEGAVPALLRPSRKLKAGEVLRCGEGSFRILSREQDGSWMVMPEPYAAKIMKGCGEVPLPPYLGREAIESDRDRYQTLFARHPGAVAAPTAGLHLSAELQRALVERGVKVASITLHVGIGTFQTLRAEDVARGELHEEWYSVPETTVTAVREAKRVIAVGTTSTRALESAAADGVLKGGAGVTRLFIREGYRFRVVHGMLTNFHLPGSSLLMLVAAFVGEEAILAAYEDAIKSAYRFYSYGDAMLLFRA